MRALGAWGGYTKWTSLMERKYSGPSTSPRPLARVSDVLLGDAQAVHLVPHDLALAGSMRRSQTSGSVVSIGSCSRFIFSMKASASASVGVLAGVIRTGASTMQPFSWVTSK